MAEQVITRDGEFLRITLATGGEMLVDLADEALALAHKWYKATTFNGRVSKRGTWGNPNDRFTYAMRQATKEERLIGFPSVILFHQEVLGFPSRSGLVVDHLNNKSLDNRRSNLEAITMCENLRRGRLRAKYSGMDWKPYAAQ